MTNQSSAAQHYDPISDQFQHDPCEIVDCRYGKMERWRAIALATGEMGPLAQVAEIIRNDADEAVARVEETEARKGVVQHLCDMIAGMHDRVTRLEDALAERHRSDNEASARQAHLDAEFSEPPGTSDVPADDAPAHDPTGDLHTLPAKDELELDPDPGTVADKSVTPLRTTTDAEFEEPEHPPQVPQPISISLNKQE